MKLLHIAAREPERRVWTRTFQRALGELGELEIVSQGAGLPEAEALARIRESEVLLTCWGTLPVPAAIAEERGRLQYICHVTGTVRGMVPIEAIRAGIPLTNWGDAPAFHVAEGAMALLLAVLKNLGAHRELQSAGQTSQAAAATSGSLRGLRLGIYGMGAIARSFCELVRPFGPVMRAFDPYAQEWPAGVERAASMEDLFANADALVVHAGWTPETEGSVTADLLRLLPDGGIVINTARGAIIDQDALFAELESGRLRAGLDVLAGSDRLPPDHPARRWPNLILTGHRVMMANWPIDAADPDAPLSPMHEVCLENLKLYAAGRPLRFLMDQARYDLST